MDTDRIIRIVSLMLALMSLGSVFLVDMEIANTYEHSDGKTKAMFGIIEISRFSYKYLILIPAILSVVSITIVIWKTKLGFFDIAIFVVGVTAIVGTLTSSWRLMI